MNVPAVGIIGRFKKMVAASGCWRHSDQLVLNGCCHFVGKDQWELVTHTHCWNAAKMRHIRLAGVVGKHVDASGANCAFECISRG